MFFDRLHVSYVKEIFFTLFKTFTVTRFTIRYLKRLNVDYSYRVFVTLLKRLNVDIQLQVVFCESSLSNQKTQFTVSRKLSSVLLFQSE